MRKILIATVLIVSLAMLSAAPALAAGSWEELVAGLERREAVQSRGSNLLAELRRVAPQGSEMELWQKLWVGAPGARAAAGVALMDKIFPGGDPGRWEEASGFLEDTGYKPRQLAGMDAFFVTIVALDSIRGGEWTAASLMDSFANSPRGMMQFIKHMPQDMQGPISSIVAKTGVRGNWTASMTHRSLPLLPSFGGGRARDSIESQKMQYLDGSGRIASNGYYAWDRGRGYLYQVMENSAQANTLR